MRRLVGVLRQDGLDQDGHGRGAQVRDGLGDRGGASLTPAPRLAGLDGLVAQVAKIGLPIVLTVKGDGRQLPAGVNLSAYRIVQEALTNIVNHAERPSHVSVVVRYEPAEVSVEITDDGIRGEVSTRDWVNDDGHGLVGMRERVGLFGGELVAASQPQGGFRVAARLPVDGYQR